jgi:hypothetical protein
MATTREQLHAMIDKLPSDQFDAVAHAIWELSIPEDDEPVTDDDLAAIARGREAHRRGETISHAEAVRMLEARRADRAGTRGRQRS